MKKKNNKLKNIGAFILNAGIGFLAGFLAISLIPDEFGDASFFIIPILLFSILGGYLVQFIVHEAGHLLFGLLSGYTFVSFRVGNLMVIKKNEKYRFANMNLPGTGGQCLMAPPEYNNGDFPFILYNLGGVLLNIVASSIAFIAIGDNTHTFFNIVLVGFALGGLLVTVTNGIPMIIGGIPNDGYNIREMQKDKKLRQAFWIQLAVNDELTQGKRPRDLSFDDFSIDSPDQLTKPLITAVQLLHYSRSLDQLDFEQAEAYLQDFTPYMEEIVSLYQHEINLECLFMEVINENRPDVVNNLYDDDLANHIKRTKNWLNRKRILMAYEWFHMKNKDKAMTYYHELRALVDRHPLEGEARMEIELTDWIKSHIEQIN